jgi:3',5'-cyclic AMP phosphodiesterase CpdA
MANSYFSGVMMRRFSAAVLCLVLITTATVTSCGGGEKYVFEPDAAALQAMATPAPDYPETKFIVFSDPHLYDPALGTEGAAFEEYLTQDRKLLRESVEIMEAAIAGFAKEDASFVLVTGDLTKDGEAASHRLMADFLGRIEAQGKNVYVIPGNHDILNGHAFRYAGDDRFPVPSVTPPEFAEIYTDFGYAEAISRDPASLSYVVEPEPGLWLLALDSCLYRENVPGEAPVTDGRFKPETLDWIEQTLAQAAGAGRAVIATLHHGATEHYVGQEKDYGEYVLDDHAAVSEMLAAYGVRLVFTGHYHAQDITRYQAPDAAGFLFDVETGSLATYPNPYRVVTLDGDNTASFVARRIEAIASHPSDFTEFSKADVLAGIEGIATKTIKGYKVKDEEAHRLAAQVALAFEAHYAGDEALPAGQEAIQTRGLSPPGWLVITFRKNLVINLWQDLAPPDNRVTINLSDGTWR